MTGRGDRSNRVSGPRFRRRGGIDTGGRRGRLDVRVDIGRRRVRPPPAAARRQRTAGSIVEQALRTIDRRANDLGVAESVTARYTESRKIASNGTTLELLQQKIAALLRSDSHGLPSMRQGG